MDNKRQNLQKRMLAYSAAAVVAAAGAAAAAPGMALETDGAVDNEFDIVLESRPMAAIAPASSKFDCATLTGGSAKVAINSGVYYANATAFDFSAISNSFIVAGGTNNGPVRTSTIVFTGHVSGGIYSYSNLLPDTNIPFLRVEFNKQSSKFCIYGFQDPSAISGVEGRVGQVQAPVGVSALAVAVLAALSAAALWLRRRDKSADSLE